MKHATLVSALLWLAALPWAPMASSAEEIPAPLRAKIVELMELTGNRELGAQMGTAMVHQMMASLSQTRPDLPPRTFQIVTDATTAVLGSHYDEIFDQMVPLYAKHYSVDDIDALIAFYRTPIGRKSIETMPTLTQEAMQISGKWAETFAPQVQDAVRAALEREGVIEPKTEPAP